MRILYLAHRIPYPLNKGEKIRAYHTLTYLAARHEVWCACFMDDPLDAPGIPVLQRLCARFVAVRLHRAWATCRAGWRMLCGGTLTEGFFDQDEMQRLVETWAREARFDAVLALSSSMAPYALMVPARRRVADFCDVDSRKWRALSTDSGPPMSWVLRAEALRLANREIEWARAFDAVTVISRAEAALLNQPEIAHKVHVVANGVTLPNIEGSRPAPLNDAVPFPPIVGFIGDLSYPVNVRGLTWFVDHCWAEIRREHPGVRLHVVGRRPCAAVRRLARRDGVAIFGDVPDIAEHLRRFTVSIAPLHLARGVQNKVLEAMAAGKPVVLTPQVAEGINGRLGEHWLQADSGDDFADAVGRLLEDDELGERLGRSARALMEHEYRWETHLGKLEALLKGQDAGVVWPAVASSSLQTPVPRTSQAPVSSSTAPMISASGGR